MSKRAFILYGQTFASKAAAERHIRSVINGYHQLYASLRYVCAAANLSELRKVS